MEFVAGLENRIRAYRVMKRTEEGELVPLFWQTFGDEPKTNKWGEHIAGKYGAWRADTTYASGFSLFLRQGDAAEWMNSWPQLPRQLVVVMCRINKKDITQVGEAGVWDPNGHECMRGTEVRAVVVSKITM